MRVGASFCVVMAVGTFACRPVSDLDATRRGSSGMVSPSDTANSEPLAPFTPTVGSSAEPDDTTGQSLPTVTSPVAPSAVPTTGGASSGLDSPVSTEESDEATIDAATTAVTRVSSEDTSAATTTAQASIALSSETPDTTATTVACPSKCGLGAICEELTDCLSLRCDDVCQPTELVVESNGLDAISTSIKMHVELYADPSVAVAWQDLAVLYFVTVEKHDDFKLNFAQGGGTTMPMQVTLEDWILVWTTDAPGNVPSTVTPFDVQIHSYPWLADNPESNDNSNDYSYRSGLGVNENIVLCRRVEGQWRHAQGTAPAAIVDPCRYVDNCQAALSCDPLEPSPTE